MPTELPSDPDASTPRPKRRKGKGIRTNDHWWLQKDPAEQLPKLVQELLERDRPRALRYERFCKLYGGTRLIGLRPWETPYTSSAAISDQRAVQDSLRLNIVRAAIDTITSKVGKLRPRPTFLTSGGDWTLQRKAKQLQRFMDGAYHQSDAYEVAPEVFRDAMLLGTGALHVYGEEGRIRCERTPTWELVVDAADAMYGDPRCLYRVKWVSRSSVEAIWGARTTYESNQDPEYGDAEREGYVRVVEAWCRPLAGECGRHVLVVGGEVELDEDWDYDGFPFVFVHWSKPVQGFWGDSATQEVVGLQIEINKLIQLVQKSFQLVGQPWVFRLDGAVLKPDRTMNGVAQEFVIDRTVANLDSALKVVTFNPINPIVIQHIWSLYAKAFEILGSNQLAASATVPAGMESGRAIERLSEEHSERFMTVSRHFEHAIGKGLSQQFIRVAKGLDAESKADGGPGFQLNAQGDRRSLLKLKWGEVSIDEDGYQIQVFPESALSTTPSVRMDDIDRMQQAGWVQPTEARKLLGFPDLEASTDLATADADNLGRQLSAMLEDGKSIMPEPYQDLDQALVMAQHTILRAQADGAPGDHIERVRQFMGAVETLIARRSPPPAPAGPPAPAPAVGGPPPGA